MNRVPAPILPLLLALALAAGACGDDAGGTTQADTSSTTDTLVADASITGDVSVGQDSTAGDAAGPDAAGPDAVAPDAVVQDTAPPKPECTTDADCAAAAAGPLCDVVAGTCGPLPLGHAIGWRDGSAESVDFTELFRPKKALEAVDLEFHPTRDELWVTSRPFVVAGTCAQSNPFSARCASLTGYTTIITQPGTPAQTVKELEDGNAWHFMRRPPAMAMGTPDRFATCGEAATGNFEDDPAQFIGPTLWSTDLAVFAQPSGGNGSHMDMLHATPWCAGIAWERDNVYWVFNGSAGSIDRYDFHADHGPGADDHSDGEIHRYIPGIVKRVPGVPSHMAFNPANKLLYIADTGNQRLITLDTASGTPGAAFSPVYELLADWGFVNGAAVTELVPAGNFVEPSGLELYDGLLYVSDRATSRIYAFDLKGTMVRSLETGLPAGSLAGLAFDTQGRAYFTNMLTGSVTRIDPR
ncbi:MAG: hypothetical protein R3F39_11585 [Myxococcota bacterium]